MIWWVHIQPPHGKTATTSKIVIAFHLGKFLIKSAICAQKVPLGKSVCLQSAARLLCGLYIFIDEPCPIKEEWKSLSDMYYLLC
jgi:hypothetical protein